MKRTLDRIFILGSFAPNQAQSLRTGNAKQALSRCQAATFLCPAELMSPANYWQNNHLKKYSLG
jgi:hypothetical protein